MADNYTDRYLILDGRATCICGIAPHPHIQALANAYGFTYEEALEYVITIGLAYAHRPPKTAWEPGA